MSTNRCLAHGFTCVKKEPVRVYMLVRKNLRSWRKVYFARNISKAIACSEQKFLNYIFKDIRSFSVVEPLFIFKDCPEEKT